MAGKRKKGPARSRPRAVSGARPVVEQQSTPSSSRFRWRGWLVRSLVVGAVVTLVTLGTSPPKHTDAGSLTSAIVPAVVVYSLISLAIFGAWELFLRYRKRMQQ